MKRSWTRGGQNPRSAGSERRGQVDSRRNPGRTLPDEKAGQAERPGLLRRSPRGVTGPQFGGCRSRADRFVPVQLGAPEQVDLRPHEQPAGENPGGTAHYRRT